MRRPLVVGLAGTATGRSPAVTANGWEKCTRPVGGAPPPSARQAAGSGKYRASGKPVFIRRPSPHTCRFGVRPGIRTSAPVPVLAVVQVRYQRR